LMRMAYWLRGVGHGDTTRDVGIYSHVVLILIIPGHHIEQP
jgi:hypothetical protein